MRTWVTVAVVVFVASGLLSATEGIRKKQTVNLYPVRVGNLYGYMNSADSMRIAPRFDYGWAFRDGVAKVEVHGKVGFIGPDGKYIIEPRNFGEVENFSEGLAVVVRNGKSGFINARGELAIPAQYQYAYEFSEGVAAVQPDYQSCGFIDKSGKYVIEPKFQDSDCYGFSEGLAHVQLDGKLGFIDHSGNFVIAPIYDSAGHFEEGLAPVCITERCGYIDKEAR